MMYRPILASVVALAILGCNRRDEPGPTGTQTADGITLTSDWDARLAAEEVARGRLDPAWARVVQLDTAGLGPGEGSPEQWEDISATAVNMGATHLPVYGEVAGPTVLRVQVLLDRALFSPGIIDGHWGKNTEKAVYWLQHREGLRTTGRVDEETLNRLAELAGNVRELVVAHTLSPEEVEGPFVRIPEDIYDKAALDCLCYESLSEKLGERFHTSPDLLRLLNPDKDLDSLSAGDVLHAPAIRSSGAGTAVSIDRLVVSADGFYVHALDASGRIQFHFPSTMGSSFDPSPSGQHSVTSIAKDPWWHYQPAILAHIDDDEPDARIPPGPNNAVGMVWMGLSIPHYGIHGTSAPETIGYTTSAGCVRLTNWDALFLADRIDEGIEVEFAPRI